MTKKIGVIGDIILDSYLYGDIKRINPESHGQLIDVLIDEKGSPIEKNVLGGAANVANNIASIEGKVKLYGIANENDVPGKELIKLCSNSNIEYFFVNDNRPTTKKTRIMSDKYNQQILRMDYEVKHSISNKYANKLIDEIKKENINYLIVSDYAKGVITEYFMNKLNKEFKGKILVDPKPKHCNFYNGVYLLKPNQNETRDILRMNKKLSESEELNIGNLKEHIIDLYGIVNAENILVTAGKSGSMLYETEKRNIEHYPTEAKNVFDVSGAGDTYIATIAHCLNEDYSLEESVKIANKAAGVVVGKVGTATVEKDEFEGILRENNYLK